MLGYYLYFFFLDLKDPSQLAREHFAIGMILLRTRSCIHCMRFSTRIKSPQDSGHAYSPDATKFDPSYRNATQEH